VHRTVSPSSIRLFLPLSLHVRIAVHCYQHVSESQITRQLQNVESINEDARGTGRTPSPPTHRTMILKAPCLVLRDVIYCQKDNGKSECMRACDDALISTCILLQPFSLSGI
jgi:hypothetical protein